MALIAKKALSHKGRFIPKGGKVPANYKRIRDGLKRGWIIDDGGPAASSPKAAAGKKAKLKPKRGRKPKVKSTTKVAKAPVVETPQATEQTGSIPERPFIENLDYLTPLAIESLNDNKIVLIHDLEGWTVESLDELKGIGPALAARLIADYDAFAAQDGIQLDDESPEAESGADDETTEDEIPGEEDDPA